MASRNKPIDSNPSIWVLNNLFCAGLAPSLSIVVTSPLDVIKAQMQTPKASGTSSILKIARAIARKEGVSGLYSGLRVSVLREASLNVIRLGLFDPMMSIIHPGYQDMGSVKDTGLPPLYKRAVCAGMCGGFGSFLANPVELVKSRLQSDAGAAGHGVKHNYKGGFDAIRRILEVEGFPALWKGAGVFAVRNAIGSATNLSTFTALKAYGLRFCKDAWYLDTVCGFVSGFATTCVMCPADLVKTRLQNQPVDSATGRGKSYANFVDAVVKIFRSEGGLAFYKGFWSLFLRTGPHYVLTFSIFGVLKRELNS